MSCSVAGTVPLGVCRIIVKQQWRSTQNVSLINTAHAGHILSNAISRKTWKVKNFPHIIAHRTCKTFPHGIR